MICTITDEELAQFMDDYCGISPCSEYGMCEECPWGESDEGE